jgi:hypothetical protein
VVCGDAGGGRALVPVIRKLKEGEHEVFAYAYRASISLWKNMGVSFTEVSSGIGLGEINQIFESIDPRIIVTGTSLDTDYKTTEVEKRFILSARARGIPTVSVLDFWGNYAGRFGDNRGELVYLPDKIAVMDERAFCELVENGVNPNKLAITGQPTYDDLDTYKTTVSHASIKKIRKSFGVKGKLVMFASQPVEAIYGNDYGYTEKSVLKLLIDTLDDIGGDITLLIRPHPRESEDYYKTVRGKNVSIVVSKDWNYRHQVLASDIITGMSTALLVEACYLGKIVISIQPHIMKEDVLPSNRGGWSYPVYSEKELRPLLNNLLFDGPTREKALKNVGIMRYHGTATDNIVSLIYGLIGVW